MLLHAAANIAFQYRRMANEQRVLRETFPGYEPGIRGLFGTRSDAHPDPRYPLVTQPGLTPCPLQNCCVRCAAVLPQDGAPTIRLIIRPPAGRLA